MNCLFARGPRRAAFFVSLSLAFALQAPHAIAQFPADSVAAPVVPLASPPLAVAPTAIPANITSGTYVSFVLSTAPPTRARIALFEAGREPLAASIAGDVRRDTRDWTRLADGRWQTRVQIEASPGRYELRLVSDDKKRTPLAFAPVPLVVTGITRSAGWWLLNGSPLVIAQQRTIPGATENPAALPLFIQGLKRGTGKKFEARDVAVDGEVVWKTLPLSVPVEAWQPNFDAALLRAQLQKTIGEARAVGSNGFLGVAVTLELPPANTSSADAVRVANLARSTVENAAPGAALIFSPSSDIFPLFQARPTISTLSFASNRVAQEFAARCDAIAISGTAFLASEPQEALWAVKIARRIAEEQTAYDLPIFVQNHELGNTAKTRNATNVHLDFLFAGATGLVLGANHPDSVAILERAFQRNRSLFVGSVTLEDIGILPAPDKNLPSTTDNGLSAPNDFLTIQDEKLPRRNLYESLRGVGRIPLLARLKSAVPESFVMVVGNRVSDETIRALRTNAERGARIYIEGTPQFTESAEEKAWTELVGASAKTAERRETEMTLQDGWTFGTGRGTRIKVVQNATLTLAKPSMSSQTKEKKGEFRPLSSRAAATLADGTPALVINPVGKGEILWMPHIIGPRRNLNLIRIPPALLKPDTGSASPQLYYAAVAAYVQPGLVSLRDATEKNADLASAANVRVALRRSPKGALLLALLNSSDKPARIAATVDGAAGVALDLETDAALPLDVRGFASEVIVTVPANSWKLVALATTRAELDAERLAPLSRASLK